MLNRSGSQFQKYDLFNMLKSVNSQLKNLTSFEIHHTV